MDHVKELMHESNVEMIQMVPKASVGIAGTITAMSINDWVGLVVGILTAIFMVLQIEAALRKRRIAIRKEQEGLNSNKKDFDV